MALRLWFAEVRDRTMETRQEVGAMAAPTGVCEPSVAPPRRRSRLRLWMSLGVAVAVAGGVVAVATIDRGPESPEGSLGRVDPATYFDTLPDLAGGGGELWAWDSEGNLARYADGGWYRYPDLPSSWVTSVAVDDDDGVLLGTDHGLYRLDAGAWARIVEAPSGMGTVAIDPSTGTRWWASEDGVYRLDGADVTRMPSPPTELTSELAVTGDGTLWAAGSGGYFPESGGLGRYDDDTRSWESVRPLGGPDDLPALDLAATPSGDLWALLADWPRGSEARQAQGEPFVEWWLARFDAGSQQWVVYDPDLGDPMPWVMAADDDAVWLAQGDRIVPGQDSLDGVLRFDGGSWTSYAQGEPVQDVGVAVDGSVWMTIPDRIGVTRLETGPDAGREADVPTGTVMPQAIPDRLVVAVGDSLTGTWADEYAAAEGDVEAMTFMEGGAADLAGLVDEHADAIALADVVFLEVDPFPLFTGCWADRACRAAETDAYRVRFGDVLDDLAAVRAGDSSGIVVVSMGFWAGDGLVGPDFHGSPGWSAAIEDMQAWFAVVVQEAAAREVAVIDVNAELLGADYRGRMPEGLTTDGIHFSDAGNEAVARILLDHDLPG